MQWDLEMGMAGWNGFCSVVWYGMVGSTVLYSVLLVRYGRLDWDVQCTFGTHKGRYSTLLIIATIQVQSCLIINYNCRNLTCRKYLAQNLFPKKKYK